MLIVEVECSSYSMYRIYERQQMLGVKQPWDTLSWMELFRENNLRILLKTDPFWRARGHTVHTIARFPDSATEIIQKPSVPFGITEDDEDARSDPGFSFTGMLENAATRKELWMSKYAPRLEGRAPNEDERQQMALNNMRDAAPNHRRPPSVPAQENAPPDADQLDPIRTEGFQHILDQLNRLEPVRSRYNLPTQNGPDQRYHATHTSSWNNPPTQHEPIQRHRARYTPSWNDPPTQEDPTQLNRALPNSSQNDLHNIPSHVAGPADAPRRQSKSRKSSLAQGATRRRRSSVKVAAIRNSSSQDNLLTQNEAHIAGPAAPSRQESKSRKSSLAQGASQRRRSNTKVPGAPITAERRAEMEAILVAGLARYGYMPSLNPGDPPRRITANTVQEVRQQSRTGVAPQGPSRRSRPPAERVRPLAERVIEGTPPPPTRGQGMIEQIEREAVQAANEGAARRTRGDKRKEEQLMKAEG